MSTLSDWVGIDIGGLANAAVQYQTAKNASNASGDSSTIDQLKGAVSLYETQNRMLNDALTQKAVNGTASGAISASSLLLYGGLAVGAFFIYKLIK